MIIITLFTLGKGKKRRRGQEDGMGLFHYEWIKKARDKNYLDVQTLADFYQRILKLIIIMNITEWYFSIHFNDLKNIIYDDFDELLKLIYI